MRVTRDMWKCQKRDINFFCTLNLFAVMLYSSFTSYQTVKAGKGGQGDRVGFVLGLLEILTGLGHAKFILHLLRGELRPNLHFRDA